MGAASLTCDRCRARLPVTALNSPDLVACPLCNTPLRFVVFPAYYRAHAPAQTGEAILIDGESSCFYHPGKKAVVLCDGCGRFLCALCDVDFDAKHLCPKCLEAGKEKKTLDTLETERYRYDSLAFGLAVLGLLPCMWYFLIFIAPAALYISIRHWNTPFSVVENGKWRFVVAIILALLELGFLIMFLSFLIIGLTTSNV